VRGHGASSIEKAIWLLGLIAPRLIWPFIPAQESGAFWLFHVEVRMSGFETLIYEKSDSVAYVTLNRPQALNVYNIKMRDELFEVLSGIKDDPEVRVAIFKGAGEKAFCAGADLSEFLSAPSPVIARQVRFGRDVWGLFLSVPQPLIAAVQVTPCRELLPCAATSESLLRTPNWFARGRTGILRQRRGLHLSRTIDQSSEIPLTNR
jgi:hypothetical protein